MSLSKRIKIENKVFTKSDIQKIWKKILRQYKLDVTDTRRIDLIIGFESNIERQYKDENAWANIENELDFKKCKSIRIDYYNYSTNNEISFNINNLFGEYIFIKSDIDDWVNAQYVEFSELLETVESHNIFLINILQQYIIPFVIFFAIVIVMVLYIKLYQFIVVAMLASVLSSQLGYFIKKTAFPNIEFDFGPGNKKTAKKWRKVLGWVFSVVIIGVLVLGLLGEILGNIVWDLIKPE